MSEPYTIDPAWPEVRDTRLDSIDDSAMDDCETCWCRAAEFIVDRGGVETLVCGVCR